MLAWGFALGAAGWAAAVAAAPFCATHLAKSPAVLYGSAAVYFVGGVVCHQHSNRSFVLWGAQAPVCARCTGIYAGAAAGAAAALAAAYVGRWRQLRDGLLESLAAWRVWLILFAAPTALTFGLEKLLGVPLTNAIRACAGVPLGFSVAWVALSSLRGRRTHNDRSPEVNCRDAIDNGGSARSR